ncbi:MAG: hypothetical protein WAN22_28775 [Solirubrobacteraceae bacterium]
MRARWKIVGLAGVAGVAATGVVISRQRRARRDYDPDELRERLHRRLAEAATSDGRAAAQGDGLSEEQGGWIAHLRSRSTTRNAGQG